MEKAILHDVINFEKYELDLCPLSADVFVAIGPSPEPREGKYDAYGDPTAQLGDNVHQITNVTTCALSTSSCNTQKEDAE